jgi:hypothetical protein
VGLDGDEYRTDLGLRKNRIFLQKGLDKQVTGPVTDLPARQSNPSCNRSRNGLSASRKPVIGRTGGPADVGGSTPAREDVDAMGLTGMFVGQVRNTGNADRLLRIGHALRRTN